MGIVLDHSRPRSCASGAWRRRQRDRVPVTPPRLFPLHDAAVLGVAATVAAKRWLDCLDMMRRH